jgi:hypothetical protein
MEEDGASQWWIVYVEGPGRQMIRGLSLPVSRAPVVIPGQEKLKVEVDMQQRDFCPGYPLLSQAFGEAALKLGVKVKFILF